MGPANFTHCTPVSLNNSICENLIRLATYLRRRPRVYRTHRATYLRVSKTNCQLFRPKFRLQKLGNRLSKSREIYCASFPDYGPLSIKISSDSDKWFPSYCRRKFELISRGIVNKVNKNHQFFRPNF